MTTHRFRRLIPRFSLGNLLMLMVVVGLCLTWYDQRRKLGEQAKAIEKQRLEITRLAVNNVLRSDMADEEKARALGPFIRLGDPVEQIEKWCGELGPIGSDGSGSEASFPECDLAIQFGWDNLICGFGYYKVLHGARGGGNVRTYTPLAPPVPSTP